MKNRILIISCVILLGILLALYYQKGFKNKSNNNDTDKIQTTITSQTNANTNLIVNFESLFASKGTPNLYRETYNKYYLQSEDIKYNLLCDEDLSFIFIKNDKKEDAFNNDIYFITLTGNLYKFNAKVLENLNKDITLEKVKHEKIYKVDIKDSYKLEDDENVFYSDIKTIYINDNESYDCFIANELYYYEW